MKLIFPSDYPNSPPTLKLMNKLPCHPNVLNDYEVCLDLLEDDRDKIAQGWTSA